MEKLRSKDKALFLNEQNFCVLRNKINVGLFLVLPAGAEIA